MKGNRSTLASAMLLITGILVGGSAAAAIVVAVAGLVRGDAPTEALAVPRFVEESPDDGIDQAYEGEFQYFVGGGVAVFDCNQDLLPDMYVAGGTGQAGLYVNHSPVGGELGFERQRSPVTDLTNVTGAYPIDIDSDGETDLAVLRVGENALLRGTGDCQFEETGETWGFEGGEEWTAAFSATWEPGQTLPTLAFGNYLTLGDRRGREECEDQFLLRPADATRYAERVRLTPGWCTLSILFSDWSGRGDRDLRMTNDRHYYTHGQEQMWRVDAGEPPSPYTEEDGWQPMQIWGMGIASHDLTGDGSPEVFLTSQGDNKLQKLAGDSTRPAYEDIALAVGATAHRPFIGDTNRPSTAWHAEFGDANNDGFVDLFVTKGNVDAMPEFAMNDPNNLLLGQPDGTFLEAAVDADLVDYARSRGGALTDLNLDGRLDVVVVERREPVRVWRNTGPAGNWLSVDLRQEAPNTEAVGAWVEVRLGSHVTRTEVTIGGGHAGGESGPHHFGLGRADSAELRVIWPDGATSSWNQVQANRVVLVDRECDTVSTLFSGEG